MNLLDALMWLWCLIGTHASELSFFVTLFATFYIPKKIMNNQIYADLISEYRSAAIGQAVLSVTYFYTHDCNSDITKIEEKYTERYKKEVDSLLDNQKKEENRCENKKQNSEERDKWQRLRVFGPSQMIVGRLLFSRSGP